MTGSVASLRRRRGSARRLLCPIVDPVAGGEQQPLPLMDPAPPSSVRRPSRRIQLRRRAALVRAVVASSSARPAIRRSRIPLLEVAAVFLPRPPLQLVADPAASDPPVADPAPRPSPVARPPRRLVLRAPRLLWPSAPSPLVRVVAPPSARPSSLRLSAGGALLCVRPLFCSSQEGGGSAGARRGGALFCSASVTSTCCNPRRVFIGLSLLPFTCCCYHLLSCCCYHLCFVAIVCLRPISKISFHKYQSVSIPVSIQVQLHSSISSKLCSPYIHCQSTNHHFVQWLAESRRFG